MPLGPTHPKSDAPKRSDPIRLLLNEEERLALTAAVAAAAPASQRQAFIDLLERFLGEVLSWNKRGNLVSPRDCHRLVQRHVVESLACLPLLDEFEGRDLIDLGSGGGFPGIPIKLARPGLRIALVDSRRMKSLFLRRTIQRLGLREAVSWHVRIERLADLPEPPPQARSVAGPGMDLSLEGPRVRPQADIVTARAVAPLSTMCRWAAPVVCRGGRLIAFKGTRADEEISDWTRNPGPWSMDRLVTGGPNGLSLVVLRRQ